MILDATCGSRGIWFKKEDEHTIYLDKRNIISRTTHGKGRNRRIIIKPDIVADNKFLPFRNNVFNLVVFDPPHQIGFAERNIVERYGYLEKETWQQDIYNTSVEFVRVLKANGFLSFKWNEMSKKLKDVLKCFDKKLTLLYGTKFTQTKTQWVMFRNDKDKINEKLFF